jgi:hypothetical protein
MFELRAENRPSCLSMWGEALNPRSAAAPARSNILAKPAVVNGAPRLRRANCRH